MRQAQLWRYTIPMDTGVVIRDRRLKMREGLVVELCEGNQRGWGEIAPLPGLSTESLEEAQSAALHWLSGWRAGQSPELPAQPSVAFGLSCALAELSGELPQEANYHSVPLCTGDPDALFALLQGLPGRKEAKIKVGLYEAVRDGMVVSLLLDAIPDLWLRLDANRSWSAQKASQFARYVPEALRSRIAFFEEPCKTPELSLAFARDTGIKLAWDESLRDGQVAISQCPEVNTLVIKPSLTGSLQQVQEWVNQAHACGMNVVISSAIESSLGLTQLARIAAWLTPQITPGLDTLSLMQAQLLRPWPGSPLPLISQPELELVQ
ncbi:O-succinylbenzoate synthase [Mangrovibacter sp. MFB070]|uniref:o-succinylbenzoate synthase n=1 Tax=Mangrovibacter sp. MFB070 TaxID=1224318 RepID=UPI0004D523AC|nr:o-succinylbenzoate synthase [Mangrovibacter sp. MFB070]KEA50020.1 O-succinylbenzoate synthase [Mangrovibacter sp. MFB070]